MHESTYPAHTRRAFLAALAGVSAVPLLMACGSTQPAAQATAAPPAGPTTAPAAAPAAAAPAATTAPAAAAATAAPAPTTAAAATPAAAAKPAKATLRLSHWWGEQFANYIPLLQQKTGIAVQEERSPYNGYFQKLLTELVSGSAPDMFLVDANQNGAFFTSDALLPFDDYLKTSKTDLSKFNVDQGKENGYGGKTMGLSLFTMQDLIVHVNVELANKDGLLKDAPLWGKPNFDTWHWQDFVTWLKAGTHVKSDGTVDQYGLGNSFAGWDDVERVFVAQNGGAIFDDEWGYKETKATVDQPPFLEAVQFLADLTLKDTVSYTHLTLPTILRV